jgi:hypothetical protein
VQTNERTLIKQLGSWLGLLTFSKNKPVLAKDMDLKQLVADAYTRGRMIAVLPFVEKVLSGCKDTKVRQQQQAGRKAGAPAWAQAACAADPLNDACTCSRCRSVATR